VLGCGSDWIQHARAVQRGRRCYIPDEAEEPVATRGPPLLPTFPRPSVRSPLNGWVNYVTTVQILFAPPRPPQCFPPTNTSMPQE